MDNDTMVTQADRDAADEQIGALLQGDGRERLLAGKMDSLSLVQAFARHRHQSKRTGAGEHPDLAGHIADAVRDACNIVIGKVVSFDDSRGIANTILDRIRIANAEYAALSQSTAGEDGA